MFLEAEKSGVQSIHHNKVIDSDNPTEETTKTNTASSMAIDSTISIENTPTNHELLLMPIMDMMPESQTANDNASNGIFSVF